MSRINRSNTEYNGSIPYQVGDRYFAQDLGRDLNSNLSFLGSSIKAMIGRSSVLLSGGIIEKGTTFSKINVSKSSGIVPFQVKVPDSFLSHPPTLKTEDIDGILVESTQELDFDISTTALLDGISTNYIKLKYIEDDGNIRVKAKKAESYAYEKIPSYTIVVDNISPSNYEILLGTIVGDGSTFLTINQRYPRRIEIVSTIDELRNISGEHHGQNCSVIGYRSQSDRSGGPIRYWDSLSTESDNGGSVIKPDSIGILDPGRWKWGDVSTVNARWYGVHSDGSDDTVEFLSLCNNENNVLIDCEIYTDTIDLTSPIKFTGISGNKITITNVGQIGIKSSNVKFHNINVSGGNAPVDFSAIYVYEGSDNFVFNGGSIKDITTTIDTLNQSGIVIEGIEVQNFYIDTIFENISCMDDDTPGEATGGFASGVYIYSDNPVITNPSSGYIKGIFKEIYTVVNPLNVAGYQPDGDGIRFFLPFNTIDSGHTWDITIDDSTFINVQKSGIKISSAVGLHIGNMIAFSGDAGGQGDDQMTAIVRIQWGQDITVGDLYLHGKSFTLVNLVGTNLSLGNLHQRTVAGYGWITGYCVNIQNRSGVDNKDIFIRSVEADAVEAGLWLEQVDGTGLTVENFRLDMLRIVSIVEDIEFGPVIDLDLGKNIWIGMDINDPDQWTTGRKIVDIQDIDGLRLSGYIEGMNSIINCINSGTVARNITLEDLVVKRLAVTETVRTVMIRSLKGTTLDRIVNLNIRNLEINMPTASTPANNEALMLSFLNGKISNIKIISYSDGVNSDPAFASAMTIVNSDKGDISNIQYIGIDYATFTIYGLSLSTVTRTNINGVNSNENGVSIVGTSNNIIIDHVGHKIGSAGVSDTSGGGNNNIGNTVFGIN